MWKEVKLESLYLIKEQFSPVSKILYRDFSGISRTHFSCLGYSWSIFDSDRSALHLWTTYLFFWILASFWKTFQKHHTAHVAFLSYKWCSFHRDHSKIRCRLLGKKCTFLLCLCFRSSDFPGTMSHMTFAYLVSKWCKEDGTLRGNLNFFCISASVIRGSP